MAKQQGVEVELSTKGLNNFKKDMQSAQSSVNKTASDVTKSGDSFVKAGIKLGGTASVALVVVKALQQVAKAMTYVAKEGIRMAGAMEVNEMALTNMLGSSKEANRLLTEMTEIAIHTPFELESMTEGVKQLIAMGVSSKRVIGDISALGDVLSAVGGDSSAMSRMIFNLGQIKSMGQAYWMDIRQFAMAGIPIIEALADSMGVGTDEIKDMVAAGKIGYPQVVKALEHLTKKGGRFEGMMTTMSKTMQGEWANLKDTISITSMELIKQTGVFDFVKMVLEKVVDVVTRLRGRIPEIVRKLQEMTQTSLWQNFSKWITIVWNGVKQLFDGFKEGYNFVLPLVKQAFSDIARVLSNIFGTSLTEADAFYLMMKSIGQVIGFVIGAAVMVFGSLVSLILEVTRISQNLSATFKGALKSSLDLVKSVFSAIYNFVKGIYSYISGVYSKSSSLYSNVSKIKSVFYSIYIYARDIYNYVRNTAYKSVGGGFGGGGGSRWANGGVAFPTGGLVPGTSYHGDKVNASVNSGEMILNRTQQGALFNYIKNMNRPNVNFNGAVNFGGQRGQMQQENMFTNLLMNAS